VLRDEYFRRLASSLDVDEQSLRQDYSDYRKNEKPSFREEEKPAGSTRALYPGEWELLKLLLSDGHFVSRLKEMSFDPGDVQDTFLRPIYDALLHGPDTAVRVKDLIVALQENTEAVRTLSLLASEEVLGDGDVIFNDCVRDISRRKIKQRQDDLKQAIKRRESMGEDVSDLLAEFRTLIQEAKTKGCMQA
jgi:hypothetical protein